MSQITTLSVEQEDDGERLDLFLTRKLPGISRSQVQRLIKEAGVTSPNNKQRVALQARTLVQLDDEFLVTEAPPKPLARAFAEEIPLSILYEDQDLLIVNKPAGMVIHVGPEHECGTLVNALLARSQEGLSTGSEPHRPGIVHRLDKETSGCIVVAKNNTIHAALAQLFEERKIKKTYLAIVAGVPRQRQGTIDLALGRHPKQRLKITARRPPAGREAVTDYEVLFKHPPYSLIACKPHTGRMHQIRVHLQHLGHPIIGDALYGKREKWERHLLHAWKLEFLHPRDGSLICCEAPLPQEFEILPWQAPSTLVSNLA